MRGSKSAQEELLSVWNEAGEKEGEEILLFLGSGEDRFDFGIVSVFSVLSLLSGDLVLLKAAKGLSKSLSSPSLDS
jgi:hypothetical protein